MIRLATPADADALVILRTAVGWESASAPGQLAAQAQGQRSILVAEEYGNVVGAVTVEWHDPTRPDLADGRTVAHINDRAVLPTHQGRGIGSALMAWAEGFARVRGYQWVAVQVPPTLPHVHAECLRRGYLVREQRAGFAVLVLSLQGEA